MIHYERDGNSQIPSLDIAVGPSIALPDYELSSHGLGDNIGSYSSGLQLQPGNEIQVKITDQCVTFPGAFLPVPSLQDLTQQVNHFVAKVARVVPRRRLAAIALGLH